MPLLIPSLVSVGLLATAVALPATAVAEPMPAGSLASCRQLHSDYPAGIAKTERAATKIVRKGYDRPIVCKRVYRQVKQRLDSNRNGVACEVR